MKRAQFSEISWPAPVKTALDLCNEEARMIDFLAGALLTPGPAWIGLVIGILAAWGAWVLLPESVDRASIAAWLVGGGFAAGLLWAAATEKKKDGKV